MTKLKAVSAAVAAIVMAALGSATVFAWNYSSIEASSKCKDQKAYVYVTAHDGGDHFFRNTGYGTLIFKQGSTSVYADWTFDEYGDEGQVIAKVDFTDKSTGKWKVYVDENRDLKAEVQVKSCTSSSPTESASPTTSTSPTSEASPTTATSPTTGTSPASAAASPTTLPSPPVTGAGPGDGGFSAALIALGLVILVGGGLTLFLSRGSSSSTTT